MSFLNTIRGLGRGKKNKKDLEGASPKSFSVNRSTSPQRRGNASRVSPTRQNRANNQRQFVSHSPTRSGKNSVAKPQQPVKQQQWTQARPSQSPANYPDRLPLFMREPFVKTALVKGSFRTIVQLPKYVDPGEWIALNIFEMFHNLNLFYGAFVEYITPEAFPTMNAGPNINYMWMNASGEAVNLPAQQYIDFVFSWISSKINDQSVFPTKSGGAFLPTFMKDCKNISRQLFRVFAFLYHNQFENILHLSLEAHFNSLFCHFVSFMKEFSLLRRSEMESLLPLIEYFELQGKII